jgi:hypothetical protein
MSEKSTGGVFVIYKKRIKSGKNKKILTAR